MQKRPQVFYKKSSFFYFFLISCLFGMSCSNEPQELIPEQKEDFCARIHRDTSTSLSKELVSIKDSMEHKTGVVVLESGDESLVTRAWLSEYAEKTIDIQ